MRPCGMQAAATVAAAATATAAAAAANHGARRSTSQNLWASARSRGRDAPDLGGGRALPDAPRVVGAKEIQSRGYGPVGCFGGDDIESQEYGPVGCCGDGAHRARRQRGRRERALDPEPGRPGGGIEANQRSPGRGAGPHGLAITARYGREGPDGYRRQVVHVREVHVGLAGPAQGQATVLGAGPHAGIRAGRQDCNDGWPAPARHQGAPVSSCMSWSRRDGEPISRTRAWQPAAWPSSMPPVDDAA